ncbi:MAG: ROK family protein [Rhodospirillales bacterium]|nr:ROK family protein [Rhodospirillales bacterium]
MRIGIDLGGTKIEAIALDENGIELDRQRINTPQGDYDGTLLAIKTLINGFEDKLNQKGTVGIGIPGTISPATGLVKNANSTCLIGHPLDKDLEKFLERPIRLANDADCFAVSEATDGAGKGASSVFGVILGTGVGGGIVINGKPLCGPNAIAGEWGHNALPWPQPDEFPGPPCYCGQTGCIETFLSGPALSKFYQKVQGFPLSPHEIYLRAEAGEETAQRILAIYENRLARSLATVISIIDPEVIVLGGGLSNLDRLYINVPKLWQEWVFSDTVVTKLVKNQHGDSSGVRGAAWLWNE